MYMYASQVTVVLHLYMIMLEMPTCKFLERPVVTDLHEFFTHMQHDELTIVFLFVSIIGDC